MGNRALTRRDFLALSAMVAGGSIVSSPHSAEAITARLNSSGVPVNFTTPQGISGTASTGFEYTPHSYLTQTGAISSNSFTFGPGSLRARMTIMGPQRVVAEYEGPNSSSGHTVWVSHTTYDVNNMLDGGSFTGFFYPDLYVANVGYVWAQVHASVSCSMYSKSDILTSEFNSLYYINNIKMLKRTGDSGIEGYVAVDDYKGLPFNSPEECLDYYSTHEYRRIPVYDDFYHIIDELTIICGIN